MDNQDFLIKGDAATEVQDLCAQVKGEEQEECIEFYEDAVGYEEEEQG